MPTNDKVSKGKTSKPTTAAKSKAKPAIEAEPTVEGLAVLAALDRAKARVTKQLGDAAKGELPPGCYPVNLTIAVAGDITVAQGAEIPAKGKPTVTPADLIASLLAGGGVPAKYLREAIKRLGRAAKGAKQTQQDLQDARNVVDAELDELCKAEGLWDEGKPSTRRGAVSGSPAVAVVGSVGVSKVEVQVSDAE